MANQLTTEERDRIAQLCNRGFEQKEIAEAIGRAPSTICRELKRNRTGNEYYAALAQRETERRRRERPMVRKMDEENINEIVRYGLAHDWAPAQIVGRMKQQNPDGPQQVVSPQTIYAWIKRSKHRAHWESHLRRRGKRPYQRKKPTTGDAARIHNRPEVIEQRLRLGDFEGDTVLGPAGTGGLATLVDRKSRLTIVVKVRSKNADHVHRKIKERLKQLDEQRRHSVTFDNGTEFARCHRLEKHLGMKLYYADPGCPYQRGTNENTNGLIRQYFPKGTDFRNVTHHEVREVEKLLNNRPRACLGFRTPQEVFFEKPPVHNCV
ncbi:MAG: IS30 family transposase [Planctomycetes bacterium]|nr:IS30 family transposase [Planctomycetota bacterium]